MDDVKILTQLDVLQDKIESGEFREELRNWKGADVIIKSKMTPRTHRWLGDQSVVIKLPGNNT